MATFAGPRDIVKSWRKLNRFYKANSQRIYQRWRGMKSQERRAMLRRCWPRNFKDGTTKEEKKKAKQLGNLPDRKRAYLDGIAPWGRRQGKEPTKQQLTEPPNIPEGEDNVDWWRNGNGVQEPWDVDRDKMLFPDFTQPALDSNGFLELIRARAADHPSTFSLWDLDRLNYKLKVASGVLDQVKDFDSVNDWVDLATSTNDLGRYGEERDVIKEWSEGLLDHTRESIIDDLKAARCLPKVEAKLVIEIQTDIYKFLQDACEELAGADAQDEDGDEEMPDADAALEMANAVRGLDTPWRPTVPDRDTKQADRGKYLDACRAGIPYTSPTDINWDFIEQAIHDRLSSVEYELLNMKENPKYFAAKMEECRRHHWGVLGKARKAKPEWSSKHKNAHNAYFIKPKNNDTKAKEHHEAFHKMVDTNQSALELKSAISQRITIHETFSICFRYVTELRQNWDEYLQTERETGEFPDSALKYIKLLVFTIGDVLRDGAALPGNYTIQCDPMLRAQLEHFVTGPKFGPQLRENPPNTDIRYRKMLCMLWVVMEGRGLRGPITSETIMTELAEHLGPKDSWSSLNQEYMKDVRAACDVLTELYKFQWRHAENCHMDKRDVIFDRATGTLYTDYEKKIQKNLSLPAFCPLLLHTAEYIQNKPPWHDLVAKAAAAEAPKYIERWTDVKSERNRQENRTAELNLRHFWRDLEQMLEDNGAYPAETKALLKDAKPLHTPKPENTPLSNTRKSSTSSNKSKGGKNANNKSGGGGSSSKPAQDTIVVDFSGGPGFVDRASRLVLEERREKEKTRGVPDPTREAVRAEPGNAPAADKKIPVNKRAMDLLELILGPYTDNQKVPWEDLVYMMTTIGFSVRMTKTGGSARTFEPGAKLQEYGVTEPIGKHAPHPENHHYLVQLRQWARNMYYGLAKYGWTMDSFKLQGTADDDDAAAGSTEAAGNAEAGGNAKTEDNAGAGDERPVDDIGDEDIYN